MASRLVAAAAAAAAAKSSSSFPPLARRLVTRRGLADQPWTPNPDSWKVNLWEDLLSPMRWKDSHFMVATVTVWGGLVFGGIKLFGDEKENKKKENWAEAKRTSEKLSSLMKEPPEALSLQDIKLSQLQTELYQVKAEAKFYCKASYTVFGVFACALIAIPSQMRYEDVKLEAELKSIEKRVIAIEKGDSVAAEDTGDIKTEVEESDASEESDAEAEDNAAGAGDGWWFLKWF